MLHLETGPRQMEVQHKCIRGFFLLCVPLIGPNKADLPHLDTLLCDYCRQIRWGPIRFDKITNNHYYWAERRRLNSSCYLSCRAQALVKAAPGENPPSCTLFSNIGKRFMAESVRRHKIPPSTSYFTARLPACVNVWLWGLWLELTAIVWGISRNHCSLSLTWFQTSKYRRKA